MSWLARWRARRKLRGRLLTREQAMAARPIRNPLLKWHEDEEGNVVVILPRRNDTVGKVLAWLFTVPESKPVILDELGSLVWHLCDGEHSVHDIAQTLAQRYKITMREAEISLAEFLRQLGKRGMVAFALPAAVADQLTPEQRRALGVVKPEESPGQRARKSKDRGGKERREEEARRRSRRTDNDKGRSGNA